MTNKILCSTGAITGKRNNYDYTLLEKLAQELECDGFELMVDRDWYEKREQLKAYLKEKAFYIPVVHCEKEIGELISLGGMASDANFQRNIDAYPCLNQKAKEYGLKLMIENVVCNVENPLKHLCKLRQLYPDIGFVFDTKMAAFHSQLECLYEPEYEWLWKEGYIQHYHINDYAGGYMDWANLRTLPVGKGNIDFKRFFDFLKQTDFQGYLTTEGNAQMGDGVVDVEVLNRQFKQIRELLNK